ncbi:DeoR family transcriptional regulator [Cytobacillus kochii]|uniref:DeoR family transcriptional regulator n=1 Tax=Cytobacillus kochii TaxID=859143 RepID=UPI002E1A3FD7|nr:DeoR family transcriptional regulator [Cytobacillus kochii]MED1606324.1 DeoR family transcriptional regulator [Cytobacillus kochii]
MLPIERREKMIDWLEKEGPLKVSTISKRLGVSEMTVYRDIKPLLKQDKIIKTSNGIALIPRNITKENQCTYCLKPLQARLSVQIIRENDVIEQTCCPHCGLLRYEDIKEDVTQIICRDFLKDTTMSAKAALYLINADLDLNCCHPQVICFNSYKHAKQFQQGFGGEILPFEEAIKEIVKQMSGGCCHSN